MNFWRKKRCGGGNVPVYLGYVRGTGTQIIFIDGPHGDRNKIKLRSYRHKMAI
jgi:hypothetical protein